MAERPIVVISTYPPEHCGVGRDAYQMVQALRASRPVIVLGNSVAGATPVGPEAEFAWTKNDLRYPFRLARRVAQVAPARGTVVHILHHFFLYGGPASILEFPLLVFLLHLRGYRVVVQYQSVVDPAEMRHQRPEGLPLSPGGSAAPLLRGFYRSVDRWADLLVVCTRSMQTILEQVYRAAPDRVRVIPVGWQRREIPPPDRAKARFGLTGRKVALFHGFLDPSKGLDVLIEAFDRALKDHPEWTLLIAGEVSPHLPDGGRSFLRALQTRVHASGLDDRVRFTGYLPDEEVPFALATADLVVLPYTMRYSHGGSAVLSRVAGLGRPLIATRISRFEDELEDGVTALLVPPNDPTSLAEAIRRLVSDAGLAERLGTALRSLAERRGWDRSADLLERSVYGPLEGTGAAAS